MTTALLAKPRAGTQLDGPAVSLPDRSFIDLLHPDGFARRVAIFGSACPPAVAQADLLAERPGIAGLGVHVDGVVPATRRVQRAVGGEDQAHARELVCWITCASAGACLWDPLTS